MSMSISAYIGPVLLAKQHPESEETYFDACSSKQCDFYRKPNQVRGKHCHQCGSEVRQYKGKPQTVRLPRSHDVCDRLDLDGLNSEALWLNDCIMPPDGFEDYVIYLPNNHLGKEPPRRFHVLDPRNSALLFCTLNPDGDLSWFNATYAEYIEKMRDLYDDVETHWGIFNYQS